MAPQHPRLSNRLLKSCLERIGRVDHEEFQEFKLTKQHFVSVSFLTRLIRCRLRQILWCYELSIHTVWSTHHAFKATSPRWIIPVSLLRPASKVSLFRFVVEMKVWFRSMSKWRSRWRWRSEGQWVGVLFSDFGNRKLNCIQSTKECVCMACSVVFVFCWIQKTCQLIFEDQPTFNSWKLNLGFKRFTDSTPSKPQCVSHHSSTVNLSSKHFEGLTTLSDKVPCEVKYGKVSKVPAKQKPTCPTTAPLSPGHRWRDKAEDFSRKAAPK